MIRFWNYLFYAHWRLLNGLGSKLIQQPIQSILSVFFPKIKKKKKEIKRGYSTAVEDPKQGLNLGFSFQLLFVTTTIVYGIICLYITVLLDYKIRKDFVFFLIGTLGLAYLSNYLLLWREDRYLKYFKIFENESFSRIHYLNVILFHLSIWTFGILSVYWWCW